MDFSKYEGPVGYFSYPQKDKREQVEKHECPDGKNMKLLF